MKKWAFYRLITYTMLFMLLVTLLPMKPVFVDAAMPITLQKEDFEIKLDPHPELNDPLYSSNGSRTANEEEFEMEEGEADAIAQILTSRRSRMLFSIDPGLGMGLRSAGGSDGYKTIGFGVDVSKWQGAINWETAKNAGVEFAIVRACARGLSDGLIWDDERAKNNIEGAAGQGIKVGLYVFSQATTVAEAEEEADRLIAWANRYKEYISVPLVIDYEYGNNHSGRLAEANLSKAQAANVINAFCSRVKNAGYNAMLYANKDMLIYDIDTAAVERAGNYVWLARWAQDGNYPGNGWTEPSDVIRAIGNNPNSIYDGEFEFWQFSSKGYGAHFGMGSTFVDLNYWFEGESAQLEIELPDKITIKEGTKIQVDRGEGLVEEDGTWEETLPVHTYTNTEYEITVDLYSTFFNQATRVDGINTPATITKLDTLGAGGNNRYKLNVNISGTSAKQIKVYVTNYYNVDEYALVYNLTYNSDNNEYTASFSHVDDYMIRITPAEVGYENRVTIDDNTFSYESVYDQEWGFFMVGAGDKAKKATVCKKDSNGKVIEYTVYKLSFNETTHSYDVVCDYVNDYSVLITPKSGYTDNKIWIDGVAHTAEVVDGKWKLPLGADTTKAPKLVMTYSYKESGSPLGMTVYEIGYGEKGYTATEISAMNDLLGYGGYSMRVAGDNGMRYRASINTNTANTLKSTGTQGYKLVEYGIVAITGKNYDAGLPLIIGGEKTSTSKSFYKVEGSNNTKTVLFSKDATNNYFSAVFVNMPVNYYKVKMYARGYAIFEKDGVKYTVYSAPFGKDLYTLAGQVLKADEFPLATKPKEHNYIQSLIDAADGLSSTP